MSNFYLIILGGQNAIYEAITNLKPTLCIGIQYDQPLNCAKIEHYKLGKRLFFEKISKENVKDAFDFVNSQKTEIMQNLKKTAKLFSLQSQKSITPMLQIAIEFHSKNNEDIWLPLTSKMWWWEYWMLDVLALFLVMFLICFLVFFKFVCWCCCSTKKLKKD